MYIREYPCTAYSVLLVKKPHKTQQQRRPHLLNYDPHSLTCYQRNITNLL